MRKKRTKSKQNFSLKQEYKLCLDFLKDSKNFIYIAILGFFIFGAIGFFFQDLINYLFKYLFSFDLEKKILDYIEILLIKTEGMSFKELWGYIFVNNIQSSFVGMIFGIFFGVFSFFALLTNGYLLGFVAMISVKEAGIFVLWRILPHGIFELPALFISLGLGLKLGSFIFSKQKESIWENITNSLKVFFLIVFPLLIIAAIIESGLIILSN